MAAGAMSLRYFILGLLTQGPMSGYDIRQFPSNLDWLIGSPSCGSIYPALRQLLEDGLVRVAVDIRQDRPPRKVYSITQTGQCALQEWLEEPVACSTLKRFLMQLMAAGSLSWPDLIRHLQQRRSVVIGRQSRLQQMSESMDQGENPGPQLALDCALAVGQAELAWLDSILERMSQTSAVQTA
jgi:PadR family transcriptional regulator AphA